MFATSTAANDGGIGRHPARHHECDGTARARQPERPDRETGLPQRRPERRVAHTDSEVQSLEVEISADGGPRQRDPTPSPGLRLAELLEEASQESGGAARGCAPPRTGPVDRTGRAAKRGAATRRSGF